MTLSVLTYILLFGHVLGNIRQLTVHFHFPKSIPIDESTNLLLIFLIILRCLFLKISNPNVVNSKAYIRELLGRFIKRKTITHCMFHGFNQYNALLESKNLSEASHVVVIRRNILYYIIYILNFLHALTNKSI